MAFSPLDDMRRRRLGQPQPGSNQQSPGQPPGYVPPPPGGGFNPGGYGGYQMSANPYDTSMDPFKNAVARGEDPGWQGLVGAMPGYQGILGKDGQPQSMYQYNPGGSSFRKLRDMGQQEGPTDIYKQQNELINLNLANDMDRVGNESNNAYGMAASDLAQSGGVDAGNRERLADSNQLGRMRGMQTASNAASLNRGQAGLADAALKVDLMGRTSDMENKARQFNTAALLDDRSGFNQFNQDMYKATGAIYGNNQIANAMGGGGGGGGGKPGNAYGLPNNPVTKAPTYQPGTSGYESKDANWYDMRNMTMSNSGAKDKNNYNPGKIVQRWGGW